MNVDAISHRRRRPGLGLILAGVLLNPWFVGYVASSDHSIDDPFFKMIILFVDVLLIGVGLTLLIRRRPIDRRKVLFRCTAVLLSLVFVEVLLHAVHFVMQSGRDDSHPVTRLPFIRDKAWVKGLADEILDVTRNDGFAYHSLLGWTAKEYHGTHVNVDARGLRKTWNPIFPPEKKVATIYMFGGSTTWGMWARDDQTVPSHLSRWLHEHGHEFIVYNYGNLAYTATQEWVHLILLLKQGHRPDYVLSYDGVNDVYGAYESGAAGSRLNVFGMRNKFGADDSPFQLLRVGLRGLLAEHSMIYHYISRINAILSPPSVYWEAAAGYDDGRLKTLAGEIADHYASSHELLDHLSKAYGFEYLSFWQPVAFTEDQLLEEEKKTDVRMDDPALGKLYRYVRKALKTKSLPNHHDIADALKDRAGNCYVDYCHLCEEGNAAVAERIGRIFTSKFSQQ